MDFGWEGWEGVSIACVGGVGGGERTCALENPRPAAARFRCFNPLKRSIRAKDDELGV